MHLRALGWTLALGVGAISACSGESSLPSTKGSGEPKSGLAQKPAAIRAEGYLVTEAPSDGAFAVFANGQAAPLFVSASDFPGVIRAAADLQGDIEKVTGVLPSLTEADTPTGSTAILIGTLGQSALIDSLVAAGKIDVSSIEGKWEAFIVAPVAQPVEGVDQGLVIVGSDKRGTIYGIYELSEEMGVSPWHYFADVPARARSAVYVPAGLHSMGEPAVKYRGFFINDENPALYDWYRAAFSQPDAGIKSDLYVHVFELLLRMKGNYLWPAMWGKSFNVDDAQNGDLADEYGVVMGTSHHEPLTRSEQEWYDTGHTQEQWNYGNNGAELRSFWQDGVERSGDREVLLTVGMRGSGDVPNPDAGIPLMESIVSAQRQIIGDVTGKDPAQVPQVWTLYKEVQGYYDDGMQVPEDITLMFADDNWGNIRRLPTAGANRSGGYGVYYHYDYVGGPRSYKWLNTNPIPRVWEQMRRAYALGADRVWIVNVGDIKPVEYPLHFFMDLAWDPEGWTAARLADYPRRWAKAQFGDEHAAEIGQLVSQYSKFNGRRKPELLSGSTYHATNFREATRVVEEYNALVTEAEAIEATLPENVKDAYFQLVLHPILACANLNDMYVSQAKNGLYADQGRASTNTMAQRVGDLFDNDTTIMNRYHSIADGKWNHMMKQTHIGYTNWEQPATQVRPTTETISVGAAALGVAVEGSAQAVTSGTATLPELSVYHPDEVRHIEVFNRGNGSVDFTAVPAEAYVSVDPASGTLGEDATISVSVDWSQVPAGDSEATIAIGGITVALPLRKPASPDPATVVGFVEQNGYISVDASHYTSKIDAGDVGWKIIPDLGRTGNAVHVQPDAAASVTAGAATPQLHYKMHFFETGQVEVRVYVSPSLPVRGSHYRYAVAFDDGAPQTVDIHTGLPDDFFDTAPTWEGWVSDNIIVKTTNLSVSSAGEHDLKLFMVDSGVVVQKIVVARAGLPGTYLGPPTRRPLNVEVEEVLPDTGNEPGTPGSSGGASSAAGGTGNGSGSGGAPGGGAASGVGGAVTGVGGNAPGTPGAGGVDGSGAGAATDGTGMPGEGCGCRTTGRASTTPWAGWAALLGLCAVVARRRRGLDGARQTRSAA